MTITMTCVFQTLCPCQRETNGTCGCASKKCMMARMGTQNKFKTTWRGLEQTTSLQRWPKTLQMEGICPKMTEKTKTFQIELFVIKTPTKTQTTQFLLSFSEIFAYVVKCRFWPVRNAFGTRLECVRDAFGTHLGHVWSTFLRYFGFFVGYIKQITGSSSLSRKKRARLGHFECKMLLHVLFGCICHMILGLKANLWQHRIQQRSDFCLQLACAVCFHQSSLTNAEK